MENDILTRVILCKNRVMALWQSLHCVVLATICKLWMLGAS